MMDAFVAARIGHRKLRCGDRLKLHLPNRMKMPIDLMHEWHPEASCDEKRSDSQSSAMARTRAAQLSAQTNGLDRYSF